MTRMVVKKDSLGTDVTRVGNAREMAAKVSGVIRGLEIASATNSYQALRLVQEVKEAKAYKALGLTWEEYCSTELHSSVNRVDEMLANIRAFTEGQYETLVELGLSRDAIRGLRGLPEVDRAMVLEAGEMSVGDERIQLSDKRRVAEAIKELLRSRDELTTKVEQGAEQLENLEAERDELKRKNKQLAQDVRVARSHTHLDGVTEIALRLEVVRNNLNEVMGLIEAREPGSDPAELRKFVPAIESLFRRLFRHAVGMAQDQEERLRPEGMTAEIEAMIDDLDREY